MSTSKEPQRDDVRICVAGAGAIGVTIATRLSKVGFHVTMIARGETLEAISRNGITLIDREGSHTLNVEVGVGKDFASQDIIFLCPKSHDMEGLAQTVQPLISRETSIVPVINGIPFWYFDGIDGNWSGRTIGALDQYGVLKKLLPSQQIIGTTTIMTVERIGLGVARTFNALQMTVGELDEQTKDRTVRLADILNKAGIDTRITTKLRDAVWTKVVRNLITNPVSAITGATLRENFGNSNLVTVCRLMLDEVMPVIEAYGARLEVNPEAIISAGRNMGDVKTSMLQDLERGAPLELAAICDAVIELGHGCGFNMPVTETVTSLARFRSLAIGRSVAA
jgi:2-dehydropantoate 2-reductase